MTEHATPVTSNQPGYRMLVEDIVPAFQSTLDRYIDKKQTKDSLDWPVAIEHSLMALRARGFIVAQSSLADADRDELAGIVEACFSEMADDGVFTKETAESTDWKRITSELFALLGASSFYVTRTYPDPIAAPVV